MVQWNADFDGEHYKIVLVNSLRFYVCINRLLLCEPSGCLCDLYEYHVHSAPTELPAEICSILNCFNRFGSRLRP